MSGQFVHGPWRAIDKMVVVVGETHGYDTCIANASIGGSSGEVQRANAALIAAAPSLYDALSEMHSVIDAAGVHNLANGVQLGQVSWAVKAPPCPRRGRMSAILRCSECDARLPNQYAPLGGKCGGDTCVNLDSGPAIAVWPQEWGKNPCAAPEPYAELKTGTHGGGYWS